MTEEEKILKRFECLDCGVSTLTLKEYYSVHDNLWAEIVGDPHAGMLCIGCFENRLGRKLAPSDFQNVLINTDRYTKSERLRERLAL